MCPNEEKQVNSIEPTPCFFYLACNSSIKIHSLCNQETLFLDFFSVNFCVGKILTAAVGDNLVD